MLFSRLFTFVRSTVHLVTIRSLMCHNDGVKRGMEAHEDYRCRSASCNREGAQGRLRTELLDSAVTARRGDFEALQRVAVD